MYRSATLARGPVLTVSLILVLLSVVFPGSVPANTLTQGSTWFVYGRYDETYPVTGPKLVIKQICPVTTWNLEDTPLPEPLADFATATNSTRAWLSGGFNGTAVVANVRYATLSGSGDPIGSWQSGPPLPSPVRDHAMVIADRWMYVIGGRTDGEPRDSIQVAEFKFDGSLLDWAPASRPLPVPLWNLRAVSVGGFLYVIGGCTGSAETTASTAVYYTRVLENGEIEPWQAGASLPAARTGHGVVASAGRIWALGGADATGAIQTSAYYADVDPQTGALSAWQSTTALPVATRDHGAVIQNGTLTVLGGRTAAAVVKTTYTTKINADLSLAGWAAAGSLRREVERHEAISIHHTNGRLFRLGGRPITGGYLSDAEYTTMANDPGQAHAFAGRFTSRSIDLGFPGTVDQISWQKTGAAAVGMRWRAAGDDGVWGAWSALATSSPAAVGQPCRYFQYEIVFSGDGTQTAEVTSVALEVTGIYYLPSSLAGAQAWTRAAGPNYVVYSDLSLTATCNLVIEPGVRVHFAWGAGLSLVNGAIVNAHGAPGDSIYFSSLDGKGGRWKGVNWGSTANSSLSYCVFEKAGELWSGYQDNFHCVSTAQPSLDQCVFRWSSHDGLHLGSSSTIVESCKAYGNADAGIRVTGRWSSSYPLVSRCEAYANGDGIVIESSNAANPTTLQYCDAHDNLRDGVRVTSSSTPCLYLNTIRDNGRYPVYIDSNSWVDNGCWTGNTYGGNGEEAIAFEGRTISTDRTFADLGDPYRIVGADLGVYQTNGRSTLTILPGVAIEFATGRGLYVGASTQFYSGQLRANGTAEAPIRFGPAPGTTGWKGLLFDYGSAYQGATSTLDHCVVEGAGGTWGDNVIANIYCRSTSQPTILRSRILRSSGTGVHLGSNTGSTTVLMDSTAVDSCASYPVYLSASSWLDPGTGGSTFSGNGIQAIALEGRTIADALTLVDRGVPYRVLTDLVIGKASGVASLLVDPGVSLEFASGAGINVGSSSTYGGQLLAVGHEGAWIRFGRAPGGAGWKGLYFNDGSDYGGAASEMRYCIVDGAEGGWSVSANIYASSTTQPTLRHCAITRATARGIHLNASAISIDSTRVDSCGTYPIYANSTSSLSLGSGANTYTGNGTQVIGYDGRTLATDARLVAQPIPYRVLTADLIVQQSGGKPTLTLDPGVALEFAAARGLQVGGNATTGGQLQAVGTDARWIRFGPAPGVTDWKGLYFADGSDYDSGLSTMAYCSVEAPGGAWGSTYAAIRCDATSQPFIRRCAVARASQAGLYLQTSRISIQDCRIDSCGTYPIHLASAGWLDGTSAGITFTDNANQAISIAGQTISTDVVLADHGVPYRALGDLTMSLSAGSPLLDIAAGCTMEFNSGVALYIGGGPSTYGGRLRAAGTEDRRVTFRNAPGAATWDGLVFDNGSDYGGGVSLLSFCTIRGGPASGANVYCSTTNQPTLEDCLITGSAGHGISLYAAAITIRRCFITGNAGNGIYTSQGALTIGGEPGACNRIEGNALHELRLASNHNVIATHNWWGSADEGFIQSEIYDRSDNGSVGIATYAPWSQEACGEWPVPEPFALLLPEDGSRVLTLYPSFGWESTTGGNAITYDLEVADNPAFDNATVVADLPDTTHTLTSPLTDGVTWHWRVKARNDLGIWRASETSWTVLTNIPPTVPDPIYPIDKDVCVPEWYLVWLASIDAGGSNVTYQVQVDDDPSFSSPEIDAGGVVGERAAYPNAVAVLLGGLPGWQNLVANRDYHWRVQGYDSYPDGSGFSTETIRFHFLARASDVVESAGLVGVTTFDALLPNPASSEATIDFTLGRASAVSIDVFDVEGRNVGTALAGPMQGGRHLVRWDLTTDRAGRLHGGVYWIRFRADDFVATRSLRVVK